MKLTNANKLLFLISCGCMMACQYKPESELIKGHWKYEQVTKDGKPAMSIGDNDILTLNPDSTFEYHIESVKKHQYGSWTYSQHTLHLHYNEPDTLRHFEVDLLSGHELRMHEGAMGFEFSKIKTD